MAPVIRALRAEPRFDTIVLLSGQHRDLLAPLIEWFELPVDGDLGVMTEDQGLAELTARLMHAFQGHLAASPPDLVLAQGDTTTVMCAALACFYNRISFGHVEAGLRTHDIHNPFPEEFNRVAVGCLASQHFCPTPAAAGHVLAQGARKDTVHVTGNTVIDALYFTRDKLARLHPPVPKNQVLMTAHRRENFGAPIENIFRAVRRLLDEFPALTVLYPVHPNPRVREPAERLLGGHPRIALTAPLNYPDLVAAMEESLFILTDSGGIQEEAPALGKPVLVLREATERPEAVALGVARIVGTAEERILDECRRLLRDPAHYRRMASGGSPYGDGHAAERIRQILTAALA